MAKNCLSRGLHGFAILSGILVAMAALSACGDTHDPASAEQILLDKAILALWGDVAPDSITTSCTTSTFLHSDSRFRLETCVKSPDRYREVRNAYGITEIHAVAGDAAWATVDGVVVPLAAPEQEHLKLQPWLFNVSKLVPLKDTARFGIEYKGELKLVDGRTVERLEVKPHEMTEITMIFDFDRGDYLLRRVELTNRRNQQTLELFLDDYRSVAGIRVPHSLRSLRNGKPFAREILDGATFNVPVPDADFAPPAEIDTDRIIDKESIGGLVASTRHDGDITDVADTVKELKDWIAENNLEVAGPLIVHAAPVETDTAPGTPAHVVSIPVSAMPNGTQPTKRDGFELRQLKKQRSLSTTMVGDVVTADIVDRLTKHAKDSGLKTHGPALEIYFSLDGRTRQIQLPIE